MHSIRRRSRGLAVMRLFWPTKYRRYLFIRSSDVFSSYSLIIAQFFSYNPIIGSDCKNFWSDELRTTTFITLSANPVQSVYAYCVREPGYSDSALIASPTSGQNNVSSLKSSPTFSTGLGPSAPAFSGQPVNCIKWDIIQDGDSCSSLENTYFITHAQFLKWNPAVSEDCSSNFWKGYAYCVGTADTVAKTRVSLTPAPKPIPPTPSQPQNAVSNCNKFDQAVQGDFCSVSAFSFSYP